MYHGNSTPTDNSKHSEWIQHLAKLQAEKSRIIPWEVGDTHHVASLMCFKVAIKYLFKLLHCAYLYKYSEWPDQLSPMICFIALCLILSCRAYKILQQFRKKEMLWNPFINNSMQYTQLLFPALIQWNTLSLIYSRRISATKRTRYA